MANWIQHNMSLSNKYSRNIRKELKKLRSARGWNQVAMAKQAGITQAALSQIENGHRMPSLLVLKKLANALNVTVEELMGEPDYQYADEKKLKAFYRKYHFLDDLSDKDQKIILEMIERLKY